MASAWLLGELGTGTVNEYLVAFRFRESGVLSQCERRLCVNVKELETPLMPQTRVYWLHALSPTHVGTGRGVGYIDLPVQRDKLTNWPMIPGSAFKGAWAEKLPCLQENRLANPELGLAFGRASDEGQNNSTAGALISTDARLVCLPVRSFQGTFAWCSSALALRMLRRDLELAGMGPTKLPADLGSPADGRIHVTDATLLKEGGQVFLEDLDFIAESNAAANAWAELIAACGFPGRCQRSLADGISEAFRRVARHGVRLLDRDRHRGNRSGPDRRRYEDHGVPASSGTRSRCPRKRSWRGSSPAIGSIPRTPREPTKRNFSTSSRAKS